MFGFGRQREIERFVAEIDAPAPDDRGDVRVQDQRIGLHDAALDAEIRHSATQLDALVARELELQDLQ